MSELGIERVGQPGLNVDDPLGHFLQPPQVFRRVAGVSGAVGDDGEAFAEGRGEFLERGMHADAGGGKTIEPARVAASIAAPGSKTKGTMPPDAPHDQTGRSLLIVDDDVDVLRFLRDTLMAFTYCRVDTSPSPEYAFELALRKSYDLFLFDFSMPIMDGAVLYSLIRKVHDFGVLAAPRPLPPLLLMSGHGEKQRARELLAEPGVRGLLPKPFSIQRLLAKLEGCLPGVIRQSV